jgi:Pro-kumamolisin, activation domain/Viral BACON domain
MQFEKRTLILTAMVGLTGTAAAGQRQTLYGHIPKAAARVQPAGDLPATSQLDLAIGLPLRNPKALAGLLEQLYDPASPNFHRYLTSDQFTEAFGPTAQDYQAAIQFANSHGWSVTALHHNRLLLDVRGSVADVEKALHIRMRVYSHPTEVRTFYAPDSEPSLDLQTPILHISGLNNFRRPQPRSLQESAGQAAAVAQGGSGPGGAFMGNDFRTAYVPRTALTGAGQSVGLFELDGYYASDIANYEAQAGLPSVSLQNVLIDGFSGIPAGHRPGSGNEEVALDIETTISMAPGLSSVLVYEGPPASTTANINDVLNRMATDNTAKQLSCSWGFDVDATTQQIFQEFAAQGQSFFLASGDNGAFVGAVFQPSDDPYITVVGGTTLTTDNSGAWRSEETWNGSSGGISTVYPIPDWQQGIDMSLNQGSTAMRNIPDVAMIADNVWAISDRGRSAAFSGTSIAAPLWAAFTALVNEQAVASGCPFVGFINPALYAIAKGPTFTQCFHDITTGNNTSSTSPDRFSAVVGYDLCTGWGTPNGTSLIDALLAPSSENLVISPPLGFIADGSAGGSFNLSSQTYILTNAGTAPLNWSAISTEPWLDVSPAGGALNPGGPDASVVVRVNPSASSLLLGEAAANVQFTNLVDGRVQNRQVALQAGNAGFETGDFSDWSASGQAANNFVDSIDASTFNGVSALPGIDDALFVHSGIYGAFLGQTRSLGSLSQTLATVPGQRYQLSLWLDNPASGLPNEFQVLWDGASLFDQTNLGPFAWTNLQYVVTATGTNAVLQLRFRNDQAAFGLDDITVQASPSPRLQEVVQSNGAISFRWSASAGVNYQVQYATNLAAPTWNDLGAPISGQDGELTVSDPVTLPGPRFYRVVELP